MNHKILASNCREMQAGCPVYVSSASSKAGPPKDPAHSNHTIKGKISRDEKCIVKM